VNSELAANRRIDCFLTSKCGGLDAFKPSRKLKLDPDLTTLVTPIRTARSDIGQVFGARFKISGHLTTIHQARLFKKRGKWFGLNRRRTSKIDGTVRPAKTASKFRRLAALGRWRWVARFEMSTAHLLESQPALQEQDIHESARNIKCDHRGRCSGIIRNLQSFSREASAKSRVDMGKSSGYLH